MSDTESEGAFPQATKVAVDLEFGSVFRVASRCQGCRTVRARCGPRESVRSHQEAGVIRRQRWSLLNVLLMWEAAGQNLASPVQVIFHDGVMDADEAVRTGCSLRDVRLWKIFNRGDCTIWLQSQQQPHTGKGVAEVVYVRAVLHTTQQIKVPSIRAPVIESHRQHPLNQKRDMLGNGWAELDDNNVEEVFLQRITMLKGVLDLGGQVKVSLGVC